jgi:hypothetical protein
VSRTVCVGDAIVPRHVPSLVVESRNGVPIDKAGNDR